MRRARGAFQAESRAKSGSRGGGSGGPSEGFGVPDSAWRGPEMRSRVRAVTGSSSGDSLPFFTRLWFAWVCFFRVLFDGAYAARLQAGSAGLAPAPALPEPTAEPSAKAKSASSANAAGASRERASAPPSPERADDEAALQLLALLQREGRLVDFLEEDVASFADADIGAAARVVHAGCRKALRDHVKLEAVRAEDEGARVTLAEGFDAEAVKLTGDVRGTAPYTGTLRHRGWRVASISLPKSVGKHDARIVAQAEVEL